MGFIYPNKLTYLRFSWHTGVQIIEILLSSCIVIIWCFDWPKYDLCKPVANTPCISTSQLALQWNNSWHSTPAFPSYNSVNSLLSFFCYGYLMVLWDYIQNFLIYLYRRKCILLCRIYCSVGNNLKDILLYTACLYVKHSLLLLFCFVNFLLQYFDGAAYGVCWLVK